MTCNSAIRIGISIAMLAAIASLAGCGSAPTTTVNAQSNAVDPDKKAALDKALAAGILTQDEYNAKLRALTSSTPAAVGQPAGAAPAEAAPQVASAPPGAPQGAGTVDTSKYKVMTVVDPMFNMAAYTIRVPPAWNFAGAVVRTNCEGAMLVYRAESPDGLTGVQVMPRVHWVYSKNDQALQQANHACGVHPAVPSLTQAPQIAAATRPQPTIDPAQPWKIPGADEALAKENAQAESLARSTGLPSHFSGDAARVRIHYNYQGHAVEEVLTVSIHVEDANVGIVGTGAYGILQSGKAPVQRTDTYVVGYRAPQGALDSNLPLFDSVRVSMIPDYDKAVLAFNAQQFQQIMSLSNQMFQNTLHIGQVNQQTLMQNHQAYMQWQQADYAQHNAQFAQQMRMKDSNARNFFDYASNQTYYMNPETGATATIKDVPGTDGVVTKSLYGGWVQLQPISH